MNYSSKEYMNFIFNVMFLIWSEPPGIMLYIYMLKSLNASDIFFNGLSSDSSWMKSGQTFADIQHRGKCSPLSLVCIKTGNPKSNGLNPTWNLSIPHTVIPMLFHVGSQTSHTSAVMAFAADAYWVGHQIHTSTMGITVVSKGSLQKWFLL